MAIAQGNVVEVVQRPWKNKVFYSLKLANDGQLYGFGPTNPMTRTGDRVLFEWTNNERGYPTADPSSLKVEKAETHTSTAAPARAVVSMGKDDYWSRKEARDIENDKLRALGASRNTAIAWIDFLVKAEAVKLPAKQADREEALNALLDDYTRTFMGLEKEEPGSDEPVTPKESNDGEWN